jgi:hypothetical protein
MSQWLEPELQRGLRPVSAPAELWDRIQGQHAAAPGRVEVRENRRLVWAMAAAVVVAAIGLSLVQRQRAAVPQIAFHCQNPAQLRAWVRANTGLDVPLRARPAASIQLIGARNVSEGAAIAYRAGNHDALLLVARADGMATVPHSRVSGDVSTWVMNGQRFTLACADLQLACKLCHLD